MIKKISIGIISILLLFMIFSVISQPLYVKAIKAKYKSTNQFIPLEKDNRIHYESKMKKEAILINNILDSKIKHVENIVGANFDNPVNIYICSSQDVFNEYVFLSKNVRGAVYWGKLFLSPNAFHKGSTDRLLTHELTHYLFFDKLGESNHIENIPLWFREGYSDFVANGGGKYTESASVIDLMSPDEFRIFKSGKADKWFKSNNPSDAVTNGVVNWKLYRIGTLFVRYIHHLEPEKFDELIHSLLSNVKFENAFEDIYECNTAKMLEKFSVYLNQKDEI